MKEYPPSIQMQNVICARYEFHQGKAITKAYRNFCKILGDDAMKFEEFEFWFDRFKNGQFELDFDREKKEFKDMPIDIVKEIIGNLEWKDRCNFRKVSKKCRRVVDRVAYTFNELEMHFFYFDARLKFDDEVIGYNCNDQFPFGIEPTFIEYNHSTIERIGHYETIATKDLSIALKNPNVQIKKLTFGFEEPMKKNEFEDVLKSLDHQIHVECLEVMFRLTEEDEDDDGPHFFEDYDMLIDHYLDHQRDRTAELRVDIQEHVMKILPHLKPGVLECIIFNMDNETGETFTPLKTYKMARLEQWKQAKKLKTYFPIMRPVDKLFHFNNLEFEMKSFSANDVIQLKDGFLNNPSFERCRVRRQFNRNDIREALGGVSFTYGSLQLEIDWLFIDFKKNPQ